MHRVQYLALLLASIWWSLLLLPWVSVEGTQVAGVELSQTLTLMPAIYLLATAISLYGKGRIFLAVAASGSALIASSLAVFSNWRQAAAVERLAQDLTGIVGAKVSVVAEATGYVFSGLGIALAVIGLLGVITRSKTKPDRVNDVGDGDSRSMWDEQGR